MNIVLWIAQGLLTIIYLAVGAMKVFQTQKYQQQMLWSQGKQKSLVVFIGITELAGALGVILPMLTGILPWLTPIAALGLALVQLLAILTVHVPQKDFKHLPLNLFLLALAIFVTAGRWGLLLK